MSPEPGPADANGRKYRSKKQRPCDLCRSRKIECKLKGSEAACELCKRLSRRCTYVAGPLRRKQRPHAGSHAGNVESRDRLRHNPELPPPAEHTAMDMNPEPFWSTLDAAEPQLTPMTASLLAMNWPSLDIATDECPSLPVAESMPNEVNQGFPLGHNYLSHTSQQVGLGDNPLHHSLSPRNRVMHIASPFADNHHASSESPSGSSSISALRGHGRDVGSSADHDISDRYDDPGHATSIVVTNQQHSDWPVEFSLSSQPGYSNLHVGLSSEFDPFFLRHYLYNVHDTYRMYRLHIRKVTDDPQMDRRHYESGKGQMPVSAGGTPTQFVICDEQIWREDVKSAERTFTGNKTESSDMELLDELVPLDLGSRLIKLYMQFVHPRYPILSIPDLETMPSNDCSLANPIGIRSAVYALAAPFTFLDDELSVSKGYLQVPTDDLWAIAYRSYTRSSRLSHLSLLQLCLLLLHMPPSSFVAAEPPHHWALSCSALAIAESLGLNLDPSTWRLPLAEIKLRRRLWWFTYVEHTWQALVSSRPSHINSDNWDVANLVAEDFENTKHEDPMVQESILNQMPIVLAHCELTMILADVLKDFYTIKAIKGSPTLTTLLLRAQPLRTRIESWRTKLPLLSKPASDLNEEEFELGAALRLSHLTVEILIFRALLRPLLSHTVPAADSQREPISTIFENCFTCAKVATEIVSSLRAQHFAIVWSPFVRYQFCYVSTFILMNLAQSPTTDMAIRYKTLLGRWRDTLRLQARAWPLARLAAMRLDAIYWKGLYSVVHGAGPDSPAVTLFKDQGSRVSGEDG